MISGGFKSVSVPGFFWVVKSRIFEGCIDLSMVFLGKNSLKIGVVPRVYAGCVVLQTCFAVFNINAFLLQNLGMGFFFVLGVGGGGISGLGSFGGFRWKPQRFIWVNHSDHFNSGVHPPSGHVISILYLKITHM